MSKHTYYITKAKSRHLTDGLEGIKSEKIYESSIYYSPQGKKLWFLPADTRAAEDPGEKGTGAFGH